MRRRQSRAGFYVFDINCEDLEETKSGFRGILFRGNKIGREVFDEEKRFTF